MMKRQIPFSSLGLGLAFAAALIVAAGRPAAAQVAIDAGAFGVNGTSDLGGIVSLQVFKTPVVPLTIDLSGAKPFGAHGVAGTADFRFTVGGTTLGAGIGAGDIGNTALYSGLYEGILAQRIIPHVAVELRFWAGPRRPGSGFAGLRFAL